MLMIDASYQCIYQTIFIGYAFTLFKPYWLEEIFNFNELD